MALLIACALTLVVGGGSAWAAFPGTNGKIAFSGMSDLGDRDIYVVNPDGSGLVQLTGPWATEMAPAFSPDGSRIAFSSDRDGNSEIYVMDADGANLTRLTTNGAGDYDPAFSADGSRIVFVSDRDGNSELYTVGVDGSSEERLTTSSANEGYPALSADGRRLAFTSDRDGNPEIYVAAADGSNPVRLTVNAAGDWQPNFSADGARIAFASNRDGLSHIFVIGVDGSGLIGLPTSDTDSNHAPGFSPDGTLVAFASQFVCPPDTACGEILGGAIVATRSDATSGVTGVVDVPLAADPDWGVGTAPAPAPPPPRDTTPPDTSIISGPSGPTNDGTPTFGFTGSDDMTGSLRYSYKLDQGVWSGYSYNTSVTPTLADGAHTIYVRARDWAGNEDPTPAERSFTVDTIAPAGSVVIDGGAKSTRTRTVTLALNASDPAPATGVTTMRISNTSSGLASAGWIPYATSLQWTLSAGGGTKTVYVQYRDAAGNLSAVAQDGIRYRP